MVTLEKRILFAMVEALQECKHDLEAELTARYEGTLDYPVQKRRFSRDMEPVAKAQQALEEYLASRI